MKHEIIKRLQEMSGEYSVYSLFDDWVSMYAISLSQQVVYNRKREETFLKIAGKHEGKRYKGFCDLSGMLVMAAEEKMEDVLGYIYMHLELGSSRTGQFFTPYHICQMLADVTDGKEDKGLYRVEEPSCGAGGNIIAFAESLKKKGVNYQEKMLATCTDIDVRAVYMCYLQCSLYGIPAEVRQQDTLADPQGKHSSTGSLYTPGYVLLKSKKTT